ncbi:peptidylprolyl isomerase [Marinicella meishanensis]|uniref:peptidylprolyl isomerase n=1 Tax=Marinicella meishanensis TaxID=2873263 RepID=UPI001CBD4AE3|nr:peptidylprolyl isomerase [Marinicella sp. NBU2979]
MKKLIYLIAVLIWSGASAATVVRFETNVGVIDIELFETDAPITTQNFLNYVNDGDYDDTVIHRSVPGFIIQGGGYRYLGNSNFSDVPDHGPIVMENDLSNTQYTIAMARTNNPNSATNEFFFNLADNSSILNPGGVTDDGYAVFGQVIRGAEVVKIIESFLRINFNSSNVGAATSEFPIYGFFSGTAVTEENTVKINRAYVLSEEFFINEGISGGWINPNTTGGLYIEVLPSVNVMILAWFTFDDTLPDASVPSTIGDASNRWLTSSGNFAGNQYVGSLFATAGGLFDDPAVAATTEVGSINIEFNDCSTAVMTYVLDGVELTNTIPLQRVSGVNVDFCEQLAVEQNPGVATQ